MKEIYIKHVLDALGIDSLTSVYSYNNGVLNIQGVAKADIDAAYASLNIALVDYEIALAECLAKRASEYPPQSNYMDAVVKGDMVAQQAHIDACLAVKSNNPKPVKPV